MFNFKKLFTSLLNMARPVVVATAKEIAQVALAAVVAEVPKLTSGEEKFSSAVNNVGNTLKTAGKSAAQSLLEVAVEAAYQALKSK